MSSPPNTFPEGSESPEVAAAPPPLPPAEPVWNFWDVVMIAVVAVGGIFLFTTMIAVAFKLSGFAVSSAMSPLTVKIFLGGQALAYLLVLAFMYQLVAHHYHRPFARSVRWILPSTTTWIYFVVAGVGLSVGVALLGRVLPSPPVLPVDRFFQDRGSAWALMIFGVSLAPLLEELFYRGFFYPVLARRLGVAAATLITSAAFALMHSSQLAHAWAPLLILFIVGLVLTLTRVVTGSVVPGFLIHVGYNASIFAVLYLSTDGFRHLDKLLQ